MKLESLPCSDAHCGLTLFLPALLSNRISTVNRSTVRRHAVVGNQSNYNPWSCSRVDPDPSRMCKPF